VMPNDWMNFNFFYFGAGTTGRWSSAEGVNLQNLAAQIMFGVDMRGLIRAPAGYKFINVDLSQIEPRCLAWLTGNTVMLDALRAGMPLYEAHARASMGWTGGKLKEENPALYKLAKARVLALGYGAGAAKFVVMATDYGLDVQLDSATAIVADFRNTNQDITGLWGVLGKAMLMDAYYKKPVTEIELPTGRLLRYFKPSTLGGCTAETSFKGGMTRRSWWGGSLTENLVQATAREVFSRKVLEVEKLGLPVLFHVHDELTCLVKEDDAPYALEAVLDVMGRTPDFMPGLPLASEGHVVDAYPLK
jgi:DNA polymerase